MMKKTNLTQRELKAWLRYRPRTGVFVWVRSGKGITVGTSAGSRERYIRIKLGQHAYPAHCLAWLYMTGKWPNKGLDHKDGDKHNNRWKNLREASQQQNMFNRRPDRDKKYTLLKGVTWAKDRCKWQANIRIGGRPTLLGYFDSDVEAHAAYVDKAKRLHGDFARFA